MRAFKLVFKATVSAKGVPFGSLSREEWGDPATIRRLIQMINTAWHEMHFRPLLEIVDADGRPTVRGERFLRLARPEVDRGKFYDFRATRLAVFPAVFEFLKVFQHTIIAEELRPFYENMKKEMSAEERRLLLRLEDKFAFASRGMKSYETSSDVLDEVYDALIKETKLEIKTPPTSSSKGKEKTSVVRPLGLVLYNNGLYLVAHYDEQATDAEPYKFKLETVLTARCLRDEGFKYPANFKLRERFQGEFGIFFDSRAEPMGIELEFVDNDGIKRAVKERIYTANDKYTEEDGKLVLSFKVRGLNEVTSWVLSWGANVRVRKPEALRKAVREAGRAMMELNRDA